MEKEIDAPAGFLYCPGVTNVSLDLINTQL
jgi:hypothetical protein